MRILNHQQRHEDPDAQAGGLGSLRKSADRTDSSCGELSQNRIGASFDFARTAGLAKAFGVGVRCVVASLFLWAASVYAQDATYASATISGLGARNIGSAAMSGRVSAIAGTRETSGKITLFVGAASGGVWKSDDSGTRFRPIFDEQPVQSIGAIALDPKNSKNVWVGTGESWKRDSVSIGD